MIGDWVCSCSFLAKLTFLEKNFVVVPNLLIAGLTCKSFVLKVGVLNPFATLLCGYCEELL